MGLRDWVSEKAAQQKQSARSSRTPASMGLRDWVSEKAPGLGCRRGVLHRASMGLRDWVSEKERGQRRLRPSRVPLQWGSETGSRRRFTGRISFDASPLCFNGAPRLGLGEGQVEAADPRTPRKRFNGAPRLGLGEGGEGCGAGGWRGLLQWGSETGSRRREADGLTRRRCAPASMGLRDWVSEKVRTDQVSYRHHCCFNGAPRLGLGEGNRRILAYPLA